MAKKEDNLEKVTIGGWDNHPVIYSLKQIKGCRIMARFFLRIIGLGNLRFSWAFPRPSIAFIKKQCRGRKLVGAEVGSERGINAESILKTLNIKKLYLIDPYLQYTDINLNKEEENYLYNTKIVIEEDKKLVIPGYTRPKEIMSKIEKIAKKRLRKYKNVIFIKKKSDEAVKDINEELDFVYIDANHTYEYVKRDLKNYYSKLKKGGFLCGHDCFFPNLGVQKAVLEFAINKKFIHFGIDDWLIIKS